MPSYTVERTIVQYGLTPVLLLLAAVIAVVVIPTLRRDASLTNLGKLIVPGVFMVALPPMIVMGMGPALLSLSGVLVRLRDDQLTIDFFQQELISGALALRLSSLVVAFHLGTLYAKWTWKYLEFMSKVDRNGPDVQTQLAVNLSTLQYLFYGFCAACLWQHFLFDTHYWVATVLSWGLIYILDDWGIISSYLSRRVVPVKFHYYKVAAFNVLLLTTSFILFRNVTTWFLIWFYIVPILALSSNWLTFYAVLREHAMNDRAWE